MSNVTDLIGLGMPPAQAKKVVDIAAGEVSEVTWDSLQGKPSTFPPTIGTTSTTALAGNGTAAAATKLATARTINGEAFDGTANISFDATKIQAPAFTTAGGNNIAAGTVAAQLKAIGDLADPAG